MRTSSLSNSNSILYMLLIGIALSVVFVIAVMAFIFGTQWTNLRGQSSSPNSGSATQLPNIFGTETSIVIPTETPITADNPFSTSEYTPTSTPELLPTNTDLNPTVIATASGSPTPIITSTPTTAYSNPADWAKLIETTPKNGALLAPKDQFKKIWFIKNIGTTTWTTDYDLVFISGTAMNDKHIFPLTEKVKPGRTIELVLKQTAPKKPGDFQGTWMLRNSKGNTFGIGSQADQPLKVKITVLNVDPSNTYDFMLNYCNAEWWNSKGQAISCTSSPSLSNGFVLLDTEPYLENGTSDLPILWVHPDYKNDGGISGKYPAYTVKDGDHFKARIGCIGNYPKCNITFKLLYKVGNGSTQQLGSWHELYGSGTTAIDVDLSHLAGQKVQFILRTVCSNNHPDHAQGFWKTPRITYIKPLPTVSPTITATPSPSPTEPSTPEEIPTDLPFE